MKKYLAIKHMRARAHRRMRKNTQRVDHLERRCVVCSTAYTSRVEAARACSVACRSTKREGSDNRKRQHREAWYRRAGSSTALPARHPARLLMLDPTGFVYVYRVGKGAEVKIGFTAGKVSDRLSSAQTYSPYPIEVMTVFPASMRVERRIHAELRDHRLQGEWFVWNDETAATVRTWTVRCWSRFSTSGPSTTHTTLFRTMSANSFPPILGRPLALAHAGGER